MLIAIKERDAAEQAYKTASARRHETNATVSKLSDKIARERIGNKRGEGSAVVVNLGNGLGLWCVWNTSHQDPYTQIVEVKE